MTDDLQRQLDAARRMSALWKRKAKDWRHDAYGLMDLLREATQRLVALDDISTKLFYRLSDTRCWASLWKRAAKRHWRDAHLLESRLSDMEFIAEARKHDADKATRALVEKRRQLAEAIGVLRAICNEADNAISDPLDVKRISLYWLHETCDNVLRKHRRDA